MSVTFHLCFVGKTWKRKNLCFSSPDDTNISTPH